MSFRSRRRLAPFAIALALAASARAQDPPPCMPWQRNLADALALVASTGKPLLICVNIDGETACESLARGRYRDPEFAKLADGFVCVVASPDRHDPFDHDDRGRRVADSKLGRVTGSEHIDIEPALFERWFHGRRVAPRHVGVSPSGEILFDIFLTQDLAPIDAALREHGHPMDSDATARDEAALLASPDAGDRDRLEASFARSDDANRLRLTQMALSAGRATQHPEIVRMALRDRAAAVREAAARAVAGHTAQVAIELWYDALRVADRDPKTTAALLATLSELKTSAADAAQRDTAKLLVLVHGALAQPSEVVDAAAWKHALEGATPEAEPPVSADEIDGLDAELDALEKKVHTAAEGRGELLLALARATLRYAKARQLQRADPTFLLEDARNAAQRAADAHADAGLALGIAAEASALLGDPAAGERAAAALPGLLAHAAKPLAATVLAVFAKARAQAVYDALRANADPRAEWIADAAAAEAALLAHPAATSADAVAGADFFDALGADAAQASFLRRALARFPLDPALHERLRAQCLRDGGADALAEAYATPRGTEAQRPASDWFAGLAALVAAERRVTMHEPESDALADYTRSARLFRAAMAAEASYESSAAHYVCLALVGAANVHADAARWSEAAACLRDAVAARAASAALPDGLAHSAVTTAERVRRALLAAGRDDEAAALQSAMPAAQRDG